MDNITFERIWHDDSFFEVRVTASSELISACIDLYVTDSDISTLSNILTSLPFSVQEKYEYYWKCSAYSDIDTELSFKITPKDKRGHLLIEVYMLIKDGGTSHNHHCCFFIQTELGLLNAFGKRILSINKQPYGEKIALINSV